MAFRVEPFITKAVHVFLLLHEKDCPLQFDSKPLLSRNLKAVQKSGFQICLVIQGGKFPLLPQLPLTMALPSTLGLIYERVHIGGKNPGLSLL